MAAELDTHDVALFNPGEKEHNTIVLGGVDVVIPLELDMDGDPLQDDAVCLRSHTGLFEDVRLSSDPQVTAARDKRHLYYPFHDVPTGIYHVDVRIAEHWVTINSNLMVAKGTATMNGKALQGELPSEKPAVDDPHERVDREEPEAHPAGGCECGS